MSEPHESDLKQLETMPCITRDECLAVLHAAAALFDDCYGNVIIDGRHYTFITGGWSGNEDVIAALQTNRMFGLRCWESSHRGGKHVFEVPKE